MRILRRIMVKKNLAVYVNKDVSIFTFRENTSNDLLQIEKLILYYFFSGK